MSDQLGREAIRKCSLSPLGTCSVCETFRLCRYLLRPEVQVSCLNGTDLLMEAPLS